MNPVIVSVFVCGPNNDKWAAVFLQMKIQGQNKQMLAAACQMFMGKSEPEIAQIALETLEGHQRAIIAHLTVEVTIWRPFISMFS